MVNYKQKKMGIKRASVLSLFFLVVALSGCEKENYIDISKLQGKWTLAENGTMTSYSFDHASNTVIIISEKNSGLDISLKRKFIVSYDHRTITIYKAIYHHREEEAFTGQYRIVKLSGSKMVLQSTDGGDFEPEKHLMKN